MGKMGRSFVKPMRKVWRDPNISRDHRLFASKYSPLAPRHPDTVPPAVFEQGKGSNDWLRNPTSTGRGGAKNSWRADMRTHTSRVVCSLKDIASRLDARARTLLLFFFVAAGGKTEDWMVLWMPFFDRPGKSSILWQDLTTIAWQRMLYI